jgi:hypothetical protein
VSEIPNWFESYGPTCFGQHLEHLAGEPDLRFLQLGVFAGHASEWLLDNILTHPSSLLVDVDTWAGSGAEHAGIDFAAVEAQYDELIKQYDDSRVVKYKGTTAQFFTEQWLPDFDFIYVDAAHDYLSCLQDGLASLSVLKRGGILAFDDLRLPGVAEAINKILSYDLRLRWIHSGHQAWFRWRQ